MTIFGKMITIFVFLLAVVLTGFIVLTWNTRVNWKADAKKAEKAATDNYEGAKAVKSNADARTDDSNAEVAAKIAEADRLRDDLKREIEGAKNMREAYERKLASDRKSDATIVGLQGEIKSLQDAADLNAKERLRLDGEVVKLTIKAKDAEVRREGAELEAKAFKGQNEALTKKIQEQEDRLTDLKGGKLPGQGAPPAPENFRGTVRAYKEGYVEITPGLNAGLKAGTVLKIQRLTGGGKFVGTLVIGDSLDPDKAVGTWVRPAGLKKEKETATDQPQAGDEVVANK